MAATYRPRYTFICRGSQGLGNMVTYFVEPCDYKASCLVQLIRVFPAGQVMDKYVAGRVRAPWATDNNYIHRVLIKL